jgi:hypothetical protein
MVNSQSSGIDRALERDGVTHLPAVLVGDEAAYHRAAAVGLPGRELFGLHDELGIDLEHRPVHGELREEVAERLVLVDAAEPVGDHDLVDTVDGADASR